MSDRTCHTGACNIRNVEPLLKLAYHFGQYGERKFQITHEARWTYRVYSGFWLFLISSAYIAVTVCKFHYKYFEESTMLVMDFLKMTFGTVLNLVAISGNSLLQADKFLSMLDKFVQIDEILSANSTFDNRTRLYLELTVLHLLYMVLYAYSLTTELLEAKLDYVGYHLLDFLENYNCFLAILLICYFLRGIRRRFEHLNQQLVCSINTGFMVVDSKDGPHDVDLQNLIKVYTILTDIVDLFNDVFGWQILFVLINTLLALLVPINAIIIFIPKVEDEFQYEFSFVFVTTGLALLLFIGAVTIAKYGHHTHKEARCTAFLCYKLLQPMPIALINTSRRDIRRKLVYLAKESSMRCPQFSAAGFFPADYTMMFTLLTSITTYLVVLIQFNRS